MNNWKVYDWSDTDEVNNHELLPQNIFRCLIIGESSSGKTNLLFNLLLQNGWLDYENLILVGDSLNQEKYQILIEGFNNGLDKANIREIFDKQNLIRSKQINQYKLMEITGRGLDLVDKITVSYFESNDLIPEPNELDTSVKTVIIFDDCIESKNQQIQKSYFTRGRHAKCTVFYLSQSYFQLDRRLIRINSNFLILFELADKDVQALWSDRVAKDMECKEFSDFCRNGWRKQYSFIVIDFTSSVDTGKRYRIKFDEFYVPKKYLSFKRENVKP